MFCCSKKHIIYPEVIKNSKIKNSKIKNSKIKNSKIKNPSIIVDQLTSKEFTELFLDETLVCGYCNKSFKLKEHELVASCGGCHKFLHCGIAGKCVGPNCLFKIKDEDYRQSWCVKCIPNNIKINVYDIGSINKDCLCQECLDDRKTPLKYKRKA
jgi:hypothetical protein